MVYLRGLIINNDGERKMVETSDEKEKIIIDCNQQCIGKESYLTCLSECLKRHGFSAEEIIQVQKSMMKGVLDNMSWRTKDYEGDNDE